MGLQDGVSSAVTWPPLAFPVSTLPARWVAVSLGVPCRCRLPDGGRLWLDTVYCLTPLITLCRSCLGAFLVKKHLSDYKTM